MKAAILATVAIVFIAGIILMLTGAKTGQIITYKNSNPAGCYASAGDACARNIRCETLQDAIPVSPQPEFVPEGYVACMCPNQLNNPNAYKFILMCI